ncbi:MAG: signal peptidase I [Planctomycetes bacterium]|nr:signal peptidase I [Planctomycetota bacterium]
MESDSKRRSLASPPSARRWRLRTKSFLTTLAFDLVRGATIVACLHLFVFQFSLVRGSSMQPNIHDGDHLLVDRLSYQLGEVDRFDVAILECPLTPGVDYVKRIVGLPGDKIEIAAGHVRVNGRELPETFDYIVDRVESGTWVLPDNQYFVLGDNRPVSSDSREGWFVPREKLRGKVRACLWPPTHLRAF